MAGEPVLGAPAGTERTGAQGLELSDQSVASGCRAAEDHGGGTLPLRHPFVQAGRRRREASSPGPHAPTLSDDVGRTPPSFVVRFREPVARTLAGAAFPAVKSGHPPCTSSPSRSRPSKR